MHQEDDPARFVMACVILHHLCIDNGDTGKEVLHLDVDLEDARVHNHTDTTHRQQDPQPVQTYCLIYITGHAKRTSSCLDWLSPFDKICTLHAPIF